MEEVHYLVYHHIKGNVCGKLAKKFLKAVETEVDTENEPLQSLSHIINSSEKSKIAHPTSKKRKLEAEPSEDQIKQANIAAKLLNYDPLSQPPSEYQNGSKGQSCFNCNESGHFSRECPKVSDQLLCFVCKEAGHLSKACPDQTCYNCHEKGHMSSGCPQAQTRPCYNCNETGHIARDCSQPPSGRRGRGRGGSGGRGRGGRGGRGRRPAHRDWGTGANSMQLGSKKDE
ncbi:DNA-binding protein HEXBP-like [Tigriopus californicus]|uniref:DNA-binding protein HEXBP-like n=1 Tax=Tigriopus californicus TaxID=6832 RepID=UPI0027D9DE3C|nr:DNA-binding protein HEXBP-like [Tigriopus californicus]